MFIEINQQMRYLKAVFGRTYVLVLKSYSTVKERKVCIHGLVSESI